MMRPRLRVLLTTIILASNGAMLAASPHAVAADSGWSIANFDTLIDIKPDAGLEVTETIDAQFDYPKHGIYREIPIRYAVGLHQYALRFTLKGVDDGDPSRPYPVDTSFEGDLVRLRVGSADLQDGPGPLPDPLLHPAGDSLGGEYGVVRGRDDRAALERNGNRLAGSCRGLDRNRSGSSRP